MTVKILWERVQHRVQRRFPPIDPEPMRLLIQRFDDASLFLTCANEMVRSARQKVLY